MPSHSPKRRGPKVTGRRKVVRYWTEAEIQSADDFVAHMRQHPQVYREVITTTSAAEDDGIIRLKKPT